MPIIAQQLFGRVTIPVAEQEMCSNKHRLIKVVFVDFATSLAGAAKSVVAKAIEKD